MKTGKHQIGSARNGSNGNGTNGSAGAPRWNHEASNSHAMPLASNGHSAAELGYRESGSGARHAAPGDHDRLVDHRPVRTQESSNGNGQGPVASPPIRGPGPVQKARRLESGASALLRRRLPRLTIRQARVVLAGLCLVVVAVVAGAGVTARAFLSKPPKVEVTTAGPAVIANQPGGVGTLSEAPNNSFTISLNLAGIQDAIFSISQVDITDGALVGVGTPLVQIDPSLLLQNAPQFESQLVSAEQSLAAAELASTATQANAQSDAQQVAALSEEVAYDRELVAIAQGTTTTLTSPTSGYVTGLNVQPGQVVGAGQPILEVINPSVVDVSASLLLSDIQTIAPGDPADVAPTGLPGVHLHGKVLTVSAISSSGGLDGTVVIQAQNTSPNPVPIGTQVFVHVTATRSAAVSVPVVAVMNNDLEPAVFVLRHGRVYFQPVTVGSSDSARDQITSGLRAGDVVVESNMQSLTDGERVHVLRS
jgi:RND family efflux transporter MFP subunit